MKRLLLVIALLFIASSAFAAPQWNRSITVEWGYESPADLTVTGFKLYQEGMPACEWSVPIARIGSCDVVLTTKITKYTLTALFGDGTESPHSEPYVLIDWGPKPRIIKVIVQ